MTGSHIMALGMLLLSCGLALRSTLARAAEDVVVGGSFEYDVEPGDSLTLIGARFGVEVATLARDNGLRPAAWLRPGQHLRIDNRHIVPGALAEGILVNVPQRMLFLMAGGQVMLAAPVGVGRPSWPTPVGVFRVRDRQQNKIWHVPPSIQAEMRCLGTFIGEHVPPGPDNPLGKHWIGLGIGSIGIHGTVAPASIYQFQTHGCIRLQPDAAAELYERIGVGDPGRIVYEPVLLASTPAGIFLEVHRDVYRRSGDPLTRARMLASERGLDERIDWAAAEQVARERAGVARAVGAGH